MGWDRTYVRTQTPLTEGLEPRERYYYVHSYHPVCEDPALVLMECEYGYRFPSAVYGGSVYGVQFHPEKSHLYGMKLLKTLLRGAEHVSPSPHHPQPPAAGGRVGEDPKV